MTAIWRNDGSGWRLLAPAGFPDEAALHTLVEQAPQILPLAGTPRLVVVAREAQLGNGYADLIAVEPSGRIAIEELIAPATVGKGNTLRTFDDDLLRALTAAYREAVTGTIVE